MAAKRRKRRKSKGFGQGSSGISFYPLGESHACQQSVQSVSIYAPLVTFGGNGLRLLGLM
jgi:hypothetical protein